MATEINVKAGDETIPDGVFVVLSAEARGDVNEDGVDVDLPGAKPGPVVGAIGVTCRSIAPGAIGPAVPIWLGGACPFVETIGEVRRCDLLAVSSDPGSRGFARRARPGDEIAAISLAANTDGRGRVRVLLGARALR